MVMRIIYFLANMVKLLLYNQSSRIVSLSHTKLEVFSLDYALLHSLCTYKGISYSGFSDQTIQWNYDHFGFTELHLVPFVRSFVFC